MDPVSSLPLISAQDISRPHSPVPAKSPDKITQTARDFEAMFLTVMIDDMLKHGQIEIFGGGHAEEVWRSFMAQAYADQIVKGEGIGVARSMEASLRAASQAYE
jgi:Rod binding domain-containing protein